MCHLSWVAFRECCSVLISDFCRWWSFNLRLCKHFTNGESKYKGDWNQSSMTEIWLSESSPDKIIGPGKFSVANFWLEETRKHQNTTIYIFRNTNTQIQIFNVLWLHMYYQSDADSCIDTGQHRDSLSAPCTPPPPPPRLGGPSQHIRYSRWKCFDWAKNWAQNCLGLKDKWSVVAPSSLYILVALATFQYIGHTCLAHSQPIHFMTKTRNQLGHKVDADLSSWTESVLTNWQNMEEVWSGISTSWLPIPVLIFDLNPH